MTRQGRVTRILIALTAAALVLFAIGWTAGPPLASRFVANRLVDTAAERGLTLTVDDVDLRPGRVAVNGLCLFAVEPAPTDRQLLCVDEVRVRVPLLAAARGKVRVRSIEVTGGFLDLGADVGSVDELQAMFDTIRERAAGGSMDTPDSPRDPTDEPDAPPETTLTIHDFSVRAAGQSDFASGVVVRRIEISPSESGIAFSAALKLEELDLGDLGIELDDEVSVEGRFADTDDFEVNLRPATPVVWEDDAGSVTAGSVGFTTPRTLSAGDVEVRVSGQDGPLVRVGALELELRELTTELDDLYMARLDVADLDVSADLDEAGWPVFLPREEEPVEGTPEEPGAVAAAAPGAGDEELWAGRRWWEKIPQRIDLRGARFSLSRAGADEEIWLENLDVAYALRALGLQADLEISASIRRGDARAGTIDIETVWEWAHGNLEYDVTIEGFDLGLLPVAFPALADTGLDGTFDLTTRFRERTDHSIPDFSGSISIHEMTCGVPVLEAPLRVGEFSFAWSARRVRDDETDALRFERGDGSFEGVQFGFTPVVHGFDYQNPPFLSSIDVRFEIPDQDAATMLEALSPDLLGPLAGARLSGPFGFAIDFPIRWTEPGEDGRRGIDIDQPTRYEFRDENLRLDSLPEAVDVRRLNRSFRFPFTFPLDETVRRLDVRRPRVRLPDPWLEGSPTPPTEAAPPNVDPAAPEDDAEQGALDVDPIGPRGWAHLPDISYYLVAATLYREDGRFFRNHGINWFQFRRVLEEAWAERALGRGASTISMQLVKNVFLDHDRTVERKLRELFLTYWMTRLVPKERILEVYFNVIEWGPGINGVVEAADYYFGKHPAELSLGESVWLSSIVPAPRRRGRQRSQGEPADWSMRHCGQIMEGMANRDWITARELTRGLEAPVRFVTSPRYGLPDAPTGPPGMLGLEPVPANGQLAIVRADVEPERDVTAPLLRLAPEARIRALIASSISLRPGSAE